MCRDARDSAGDVDAVVGAACGQPSAPSPVTAAQQHLKRRPRCSEAASRPRSSSRWPRLGELILDLPAEGLSTGPNTWAFKTSDLSRHERGRTGWWHEVTHLSSHHGVELPR